MFSEHCVSCQGSLEVFHLFCQMFGVSKHGCPSIKSVCDQSTPIHNEGAWIWVYHIFLGLRFFDRYVILLQSGGALISQKELGLSSIFHSSPQLSFCICQTKVSYLLCPVLREAAVLCSEHVKSNGVS